MSLTSGRLLGLVIGLCAVVLAVLVLARRVSPRHPVATRVIASVTLQMLGAAAGTVDEYNRAVAAIGVQSRRQASAAAEASRAAQQQQDAAGALQRAADALTRDLSQIRDDEKALAADDLTFMEPVDAATAALHQTGQDYAIEQRDAAASPRTAGRSATTREPSAATRALSKAPRHGRVRVAERPQLGPRVGNP